MWAARGAVQVGDEMGTVTGKANESVRCCWYVATRSQLLLRTARAHVDSKRVLSWLCASCPAAGHALGAAGSSACSGTGCGSGPHGRTHTHQHKHAAATTADTCRSTSANAAHPLAHTRTPCRTAAATVATHAPADDTLLQHHYRTHATHANSRHLHGCCGRETGGVLHVPPRGPFTPKGVEQLSTFG